MTANVSITDTRCAMSVGIFPFSNKMNRVLRSFATSTVDASKSSSSNITWNEYFKLRSARDRARPLIGIPSFFAGLGGVIRYGEFNPFDPIFQIDPAFVYGFGAVCSGFLAYQVGAGAGQMGWRFMNRRLVKQMDSMDKIFFDKIKHYRAERGQSPYMPGNTANNMMGVLRGQSRDNTRQDFYGERIKSVQDYRHWLRRQRALNKEHLGLESPPIRGFSNAV
jgi:import inner membrane translocase subunit TIM23